MPLSFESGPLRAYQAIGDLAGLQHNARRRLRPAPTSEQHTRIAIFYEQRRRKSQTPQQHAEHIRRAGWFRALAGVATKKEAAGIWPMVHRP